MKKSILALLFMIAYVIGCSNQNQETAVKDEAEEVLNQYTTAITEHDYSSLVELYSGDYDWLSNFSSEEERNDKEKVFANYLTAVLGETEKIYLDSIVSKEVVNDDEIVYTITFKREDGSQFDVGDKETRNSKFKYTVKKIDGRFKVMDPPPYQP
ncbi:hypothetical protein D3C76_1204390 [compost metagenome]